MPWEVSRSHSSGSEPGAERGPHKHETGSLDSMKGRTDEESFDPVGAIQSDEAGRRAENASRHGGKHRRIRGEAAGRELEVAASEAERVGNSPFQIQSDPPGTDPYAGWCGSRELITPGDPIRPYFNFLSLLVIHAGSRRRSRTALTKTVFPWTS